MSIGRMRGIYGGHPAGHHKRHDQSRQTVLAHTVTVAPTPDSARDIGRKRADAASLMDQGNLLDPGTRGTPGRSRRRIADDHDREYLCFTFTSVL